MRHARLAAFGLFTLLGGLPSLGQEKTIPFAGLAAESKAYNLTQSPAEFMLSNDSSSMLPDNPIEQANVRAKLPTGSSPIKNGNSAASFRSAAGSPRTSPLRQPVGKRFWLLNGAHLGMAMFDMAMTQSCVADHHCVEGNPLMPQSMAGQLGVNLGVFTFTTFSSYRLKRHNSRIWWLSPTVGILSHSVGVASGFSHR